MPIYQGGAEYSGIRQAKETAAQRRLDLDYARDQARVGVLQYWAQTEAAKHSLQTAAAQVKANESALNGVSEEARLGQRTTLDVLNAQQELVSARINLIAAQRDRIVSSYSLLAALGKLSPQVLGLHVDAYSAQVHLSTGARRLVWHAHAGRALTRLNVSENLIERGVWSAVSTLHFISNFSQLSATLCRGSFSRLSA